MLWFQEVGIFSWYVKTTGTYDPIRRSFRSTPSYYRKGVADIHGFARSRPFIIEVKSKRGRLTPEQHTFREEYMGATAEIGGLAFVARSLEEVQEAFKDHGLI